MGGIDLAFVVFAAGGIALAVALAVVAGRVAAHLLYAASVRKREP